MPPGANGQVDLNALGSAISRAITEGNLPLITAIVGRSDQNHDLRGTVQVNTDKLYSLDAEVKLLKGVTMALVGSGDGSSGMVPTLQKDMNTLKSDMGKVTDSVGRMEKAIAGLTEGQKDQKTWTDGWKGIGVAIGIISASVGALGAFLAAAYWLFSHAGR